MTEPPILLEHEIPSEDRDPYFVRENIKSGERRLAKNIPPRYAQAMCTVPEIRDWVRTLVRLAGQNPVPVIRTGPSLLLLGSTGTGKTHQAYGAMRELALSGAACGWELATAADIYGRLRPRRNADTEAVFGNLARTQVLVVDDLGAAKQSDWTNEINYRLINYRYEQKLPTLITTNVPPRDLSDTLTERVASRLVEMAQRVVLKGHDRRRGVQ